MKTISVQEAKQYDQYTINEVGIPSLVLMERAALKTLTNLKQTHWLFQQVLVLVGSGNNGGDGLAIARLLYLKGYDVRISLLGNPHHYSEEHQQQLRICQHYQIPFVDPKIIDWHGFDLIIDAIFGVGLSRTVSGDYTTIINETNLSSAQVFSVDVPSGLNADTGKVMGVAINADATGTFGYAKNGMVDAKQQLNPQLGMLFVDDIGVYAPSSKR